MIERLHQRQLLLATTLVISFVALFSGRSAAHGGGISGVRTGVTVPPWLMVLTGGSVIGASFLLTSFVTDRDLIESVHRASWNLPSPPAVSRVVAKALGIGLFVVIIGASLFGPERNASNPAVVLVWIGWWSGYVMSVYLLGNSWPTLNPVRFDWYPVSTGILSFPTRVGCWPATLGLLGLAWLESVSSISARPRLLGSIVLGYLVISVVGSLIFGSHTWFEQADPITNLFHYYGYLAPVYRGESGLKLRLPGTRLTQLNLDGTDEVGFLVMMLWITTFDGLTRTQAWVTFVETVTTVNVPVSLVVLCTLLGGFVSFYLLFRLGAKRIRRDAPTAVPSTTLVRRFAPSLIPIAAGYHLAHFSTYFVSGLPILGAVLTPPFSAPVMAAPLTLPEWLAGLQVGAILLGHLIAVWVAHTIALELFPGRLQALRSQYGPVAVMVGYTIVSLWIVAQPSATS